MPATRRGIAGIPGKFIGHLAGQGCPGLVDLPDPAGEAVLPEGQAVGPEGVGFNDFAAHRQVRGMDLPDNVRPGEDQVVVAAPEVLTAEIRRAQVVLLDAGAHGPGKNDDMVGQGVQVAAVGVGWGHFGLTYRKKVFCPMWDIFSQYDRIRVNARLKLVAVLEPV